MDWAAWEDIIFKVVYKFLNRGNDNQIKSGCMLLSQLKEYHPNFLDNIINTVMEEIRIGLERNDFNDNQHKILMCILLAQFYIHKLINSDMVFYTLYMILTYNPDWNSEKRELVVDNIYDLPTDTFRINMVMSILDICGNYFNKKGPKKDKLNEFIYFLQLYILSKQYLPLEVENRILLTFENLFGNYQVYDNFTEA
jgi:regulator of nonsense transcripts 2